MRLRQIERVAAFRLDMAVFMDELSNPTTPKNTLRNTRRYIERRWRIDPLSLLERAAEEEFSRRVSENAP